MTSDCLIQQLDIRLTAVDGNAHEIEFSFADFLGSRLKFALHSNGNIFFSVCIIVPVCVILSVSSMHT